MRFPGVIRFFVGLLVGSLCATAAEVTSTFEVKESPDRSVARKVVETLSNAEAKWRLNLCNFRAHGNVPRSFAVRADNSRQFGFCELFSFFQMEVNGIPDYKLQLADNRCRAYEENGRKGFEYVLNFDGALVRTRFWMEPDSPFLEGEIKCSKKGLEPVRDLTVKIFAVPSFLDRASTGGWRFKGYRRAVRTATRFLTPGAEKDVAIRPDDGWFVLMDEDYDGSSERKGNGPSAVLLREPCVGTIRLDDGWLTGVRLTPDPAKPFRFALAEFSATRMSNGDFMKSVEQAEKRRGTL